MTLPVLTIGDSFENSATLYIGSPSAAYDVSTATAIKATVTSLDGSIRYCDVLTLSSGDTGADWANGVIVYNFDPTTTAQIATYITKPTKALIETQVEINGGKYTWTQEILIRPGNIS